MNETFITLSINKFLNENSYQVIQCIPPGGQGGIYFNKNEKIVYPDIICLKDKTLVCSVILNIVLGPVLENVTKPFFKFHYIVRDTNR